MRDIFEEIFEQQPLDPREAARRSLRSSLRTRFYKEATVGKGPEGFSVLLDQKPVRTPARKPLAAPAHELAQAIAREWEAQEKVVDPATMPLTRLANSIIDGVQLAPRPVADEIEKYLGTDLLFYRADEPDKLVERQAQHWDPVIAWARDELGARFVLAQGVVHAAQPAEALAAARRAIPQGVNVQEAWRLGALNVVTSLTGSALLALALAAGRVTADQAWTAAHIDEDWNIERWGRDEQALERRAYRLAEMQAAAMVLMALR